MGVVLLIGASGSGKSTVCERAVSLAHAANLRVEGVISRAVYQGGDKTAIRLVDVRTGRARVLARAHDPAEGAREGIWTFDERGVEWGQRVLDSVGPCDLLVLDEIGPLELVQGKGLTRALTTLSAAGYGLAVVSARPSMVEAFEAALSGADVSRLLLDIRSRDQIPHLLLAQLTGGNRRIARASPSSGREDQSTAGRAR